MNLNQVTEYQVQVFRFKTEEKLKWKAQVIAFPQFTAEGNSREAVLEEIKDQLSALEAESEIVSIPVQPQKEVVPESIPPIDEELDAKLKAMGYKYYGAFADDPGAFELFDEIERQRDQRLIGG
jgi:predicted RNase H-like HicB family nuclease